MKELHRYPIPFAIKEENPTHDPMDVDIRLFSFPSVQKIQKQATVYFGDLLTDLAMRQSHVGGSFVSRQISLNVEGSLKLLAATHGIVVEPETLVFFCQDVELPYCSSPDKLEAVAHFEAVAREWETAMKGIFRIAESYSDLTLREGVIRFDTECFEILFGRRMR